MKKSLISALTTALVVGAASTTFAAANPFEDVPADHWAYDAVAQLAADGVIEGYGDGTYRGDQEITRYEMAQMIARAMAKNPSGADKALVDKLAAEFADELNNLGVRVAALEKKVDNMLWKGEIRFNFRKRSYDNGNAKARQEYIQLRLKPQMKINEHWTGRAIIYYGGINGADHHRTLFKHSQNIDGNDFHVKTISAEGTYGNTFIELGKLWHWTDVDEGMVYDDSALAGGRVTFGKDLKFAISAGRMNKTTPASSYVGGELTYNKNNFKAGVGYHYFKNDEAWNATYGDKTANIWTVGLGYKFGDFRLFGTYAQNSQGKKEVIGNHASSQRHAYNINLTYKGSNASKPGTWGLQVGYHHLGQYAALVPTYDYFDTNTKGWHIAGNVTLFKNVLGYIGYSDGKQIDNDVKTKVVWSRVRFIF